jgi:hypothetical protein
MTPTAIQRADPGLVATSTPGPTLSRIVGILNIVGAVAHISPPASAPDSDYPLAAMQNMAGMRGTLSRQEDGSHSPKRLCTWRNGTPPDPLE